MQKCSSFLLGTTACKTLYNKTKVKDIAPGAHGHPLPSLGPLADRERITISVALLLVLIGINLGEKHVLS